MAGLIFLWQNTPNIPPVNLDVSLYPPLIDISDLIPSGEMDSTTAVFTTTTTAYNSATTQYNSATQTYAGSDRARDLPPQVIYTVESALGDIIDETPFMLEGDTTLGVFTSTSTTYNSSSVQYNSNTQKYAGSDRESGPGPQVILVGGI